MQNTARKEDKVKSTAALESVMTRSGMSIQQVNNALGRSKSYVGGIIANAKKRGTTIAMSTLIVIGNACGYDLVIAEHGTLPDDAILVTKEN